MGLWQGFKESSNWIKADVVIVNIATLIVSIMVFKVFWPSLWWCYMRLKSTINRIRDCLIWVGNRPSIELLEAPSSIEVQMGKDSQIWSAQFKIKLQSRDSSNPVNISFNDMKLRLTQGWGKRGKHTDLTIEGSGKVELKPKGHPGSMYDATFCVKRTLTHSDVFWHVNLQQPYKWKICDINTNVYPLTLRELRRIGGKGHEQRSL